MRCIVCAKLTPSIVCQKCQDTILKPMLTKRLLDDNFAVYSFYNYSEIKHLITAKYHQNGDTIFKLLSKITFQKFVKNLQDIKALAIPIDDHTKHYYSHTAILAKALKSTTIKPTYSTLRAKNQISYAGKDLKYRLTHKKNFIYKGIKNANIILVDDLITTGSTILEAKSTLEQNNNKVLFAITLANAKN